MTEPAYLGALRRAAENSLGSHLKQKDAEEIIGLMAELLELARAAGEYVLERECSAPDMTMRKIRYDVMREKLEALG